MGFSVTAGKDLKLKKKKKKKKKFKDVSVRKKGKNISDKLGRLRNNSHVRAKPIPALGKSGKRSGGRTQ